MDEEQPEHESVARIQTRLKSGGKPPKKKKERKEEGTREIRRAAKAAKSRGGRPKRCFRGCLCPGLRAAAAVGAGRAAVTLAAEGVTDAAGTGHGPVSGAGAGHPAAVVQRHPLPCQWQSQGTVGAKSRRRSFMEEQGLLWPRPRFPLLQRPLFSNGLNNSAEPKWRPPAHGSRSLGSNPRKPGASRLGASVAVAVPANGTRAGASKGRRAGTNGPRRTKAVIGPNQTPRTSLRREAKFLPQRQLPPVKILTKWRWPQRKRLRRLQLGRLSARKRASTPIYGRRPRSRPWLIPIGLCVLGSWSRMAA